ncbi:Hypothetical predicted protein [Xyrichtys novacula]|uniref:Uncharacterized protein n=1 Tax=Xyrichtys novacula TaxID=13765 RepID=A0AAV1EPT6_XYRNO|nr:Hypothetical predicted protein [Xyrichtys novacula]
MTVKSRKDVCVLMLGCGGHCQLINTKGSLMLRGCKHAAYVTSFSIITTFWSFHSHQQLKLWGMTGTVSFIVLLSGSVKTHQTKSPLVFTLLCSHRVTEACLNPTHHALDGEHAKCAHRKWGKKKKGDRSSEIFKAKRVT